MGEICTTLYTQWNSDGSGNLVYLDRQAVSCSDNGYLSQFQLTRNAAPHDKVAYRYNCCNMKDQHQMSDCYNTNTPANDDGRGNMVYLDRHSVQCKERYFLTNFQLVRPTHSTIQYKYRCCRN